MAKVKIYADELSAPNSAKILSNNPITLSQSEPLASMNGTDLVTVDNLYQLTGAVVVKTLSAGGPDIYTLTAPELAIVNSYNRFPNFVAVITATGEYAPDIVPSCLGIAGGFTSVSIRLHSDGAGNNPDDTIVQFS